jgi:hypothetical protein
MKYLIKESQYVNLLENLDKNKKFLTNVMGVDFTGKIEQITSAYKVPYNFYRKGGITLNHAMSFIKTFGPMYFFELDGIEYLYLDREGKDWFIDENGVTYTHDEIPRVLGINVMGLRFSDIINIYFNEGEPLNENVSKKKRLFTKVLGEDLIDSIREITSPNQLPIEFLKSIGTSVIQRYIDVYGPLYYFVLDGEQFLYKERVSPKGEEYEMYITNKGKSYLEGEITDRLGLSDMGLNFSDVIDTIFNDEDDVITESQHNMLKFQRRLGFVREYIDGLPEDPNIDDICNHWTEDESDAFVSNTMWDLVTQICDEIGNMDSYDEIYEYLVDNGYRTQIEDFFFDTLRNYCSK